MTTQIALQNLDLTTDASIILQFYEDDALGGSQQGSDYNTTIDPKNMIWLDQFLNEPFDLGSGFKGSAMVSSGTDLGAVVVQGSRSSSTVSYGGYVNPVPDDEYILPLVYRESPSSNGNWNTEIAVQNTGTSDVDVDIAFRRGDNATVVHTASNNIEPNATWFLPQDNMTTELPNMDTSGNYNYWYGTAKVTATGGTVVVVVNQWADHELLTYEGIPLDSMSNTAHAPYIARQLPPPADWSTPYGIVNASDDEATITVTYNPAPSCSGCATKVWGPFKVSPWGFSGENLRQNSIASGLPKSWWGSAEVVSNKPVAVIVNEMLTTGNSAMSYNGIYEGGATNTAFAPVLMRKYNGDWSSTWAVTNVGGSTAHVYAEYYTEGSSEVFRAPASGTESVPVGQFWGENTRLSNSALGSKTNWVGSVVVYSDRPILGIVNALNDSLSGDGYTSYRMINN
jgi:hypothetical protein